jgi:hypothetical protein
MKKSLLTVSMLFVVLALILSNCAKIGTSSTEASSAETPTETPAETPTGEVHGMQKSDVELSENLQDVSLTIKEGDVIPVSLETITLVYSNNSDMEYAYGYHYNIQKNINGDWYECLPAEPILVYDIALRLNPHATAEIEVPLSLFGLEAGKYRAVASVHYRLDRNEYPTYNMAYEFEIDTSLTETPSAESPADGVNGASVTEADGAGQLSAERLEQERKANEAYNNILDSFDASSNRSEMNYGDDYAGAYINEDGKLVVLIASGEDTEEAEFQRAAGALLEAANPENAGDIVFQKAKYSYAYLEGLMEKINNQNAQPKDPDSIWYHIATVGILDDKNRIEIGIVDLDDMKIQKFKSEVLDEEAITFKNSGGRIIREIAYPGEVCRT